jgi:uncharacterized protein
MTSFFKYLLKFPKTVILITLVITAYFGFEIHEGMFTKDGKLILDTTLEPIISRGSDGYDFFREMEKVFGKNELIVIALKQKGNQPFDLNFFRHYNKLSKNIKKNVPGIKLVLSLTNLPNIDNIINFISPCRGKAFFYYPEAPNITAKCINIFAKPPKGKQLSSERKKELNKKIQDILVKLSKNPLSEKNLISNDLKTAALIIYFDTNADPASPQVQEKLKSEIAKFELKNYQIGYAGLSRVQYAAAVVIKKDFGFILPLSFILMIIVLGLSFNSFRGIFIPIVVIVTGIIWTAGIFSIMGYQLNLMTIILPPLLVAVGSAYVIHLLHQYYHEAKSGGDVLGKTITSLTTPLIVTALTTIAGFAAITISPIPAIREMGMFACVGIANIIILSLTIGPAILKLFKLPKIPKKEPKPTLIDHFLRIMSEWISVHAKYIIIFWSIVGIISFIGFFKVRVDSVPKNFPDESPLTKDMKLIQDNLAGTTMLKVVFSNKKGGNLVNLVTLKGLKQLSEWVFSGDQNLKDLEGIRIDKLYSPLDLINIYLKFKGSKFKDLKDDEVRLLGKELNSTDGPVFLSKDGKYLQVLIRMKLESSTDFLKFRALIKEKTSLFLPNLHVQFTGISVLTSESANSITKGQIRSLILALLVIFIILSILFLSIKMGFIALIPNVISISVFFGFLGWTSIPLGVTVSVIASIALGIGVDSTIHFLSHFNENLKESRNEHDAAIKSLQHIGKPMIYTTFTLGLGFGMFAISNMESQFLFGSLTAFTLMICLITALNFLPSIMVQIKLITAWDYMAIDYDKEFIKSIDIFRNMSLRETKIATLMSYTIQLEEGEILFRNNDEGKDLFVVLEGSVKVFVDGGNENITGTITTLQRGQTLGEMALFRKTTRSASALATEPTKLLVINEKVLLRLKRRYPIIATKLFMNIAAKLWESIMSTNPLIVDLIAGLRDSSSYEKVKLEKVLKKVARDKKISYTGEATLQEILKRVDTRKEEIADILTQTKKGDIEVEKSVNNLMFNNFSKHEKEWLCSRFDKKKFNAGETIFKQGEHGEWFGVILSGRFIVTLEHGINETIIAAVHKEELIGEATLLAEKQKHSATVTAVEDSEVLVLSREATIKLTRRNKRIAAQFSYNMVSLLSDRLDHVLSTIHE